MLDKEIFNLIIMPNCFIYLSLLIAFEGCMAERLKTKIVEQEKMVDVVCGPDAYKDLPRLLASTENKQAAGNIGA